MSGLLRVIAFLVLGGFALSYISGQGSSKPEPATTAPLAELTPEQKAEEAAKKAKAAAEEAQWRAAVLAVRQLRSSMKNPDSFKLEEALRMDDGSLCLSYRATNSFNALVPGQAVITKKAFVTSDTRDRFAPVWNKHCANKAGAVVTHMRHAL
jgi:hypothetical protein